jgi:hypothetical protein
VLPCRAVIEKLSWRRGGHVVGGVLVRSDGCVSVIEW